MKRMKTFLKYLILLVALYFVSNFLIDVSLTRSYSELDKNASSIEARKL